MHIESMPGASRARRELEVQRQRILNDLKDDEATIQSVERAGRARSLGGDIDDELYAQNRELIIAVGEQRFKELIDIDRALAALEDGSWGQCTVCENLIEADRLLALPTASRCIGCQSAAEHLKVKGDATPSL